MVDNYWLVLDALSFLRFLATVVKKYKQLDVVEK